MSTHRFADRPGHEPGHQFGVEVFQNEFLPAGGTEVHAIVTVSAAGPVGGVAVGAGQAAEVIMVDTSGSMDFPTAKIAAARQATMAAIDTLRDGTLFAVVAGTGTATMVYPTDKRLVAADDRTRAEARAHVERLRPRGGTAMGRWLLMAKELLEPYPGLIRHAILLTDGKNESEPAEHLREAIAACAGVFTCDCRGVGTDWVVPEVRQISSGLLGSLDLVARPENLVADFTAMMENAMGKAVADVRLRITTPKVAAVRFVKQVRPSIEDLTHRRTDVGPASGEYPSGAWGEESRDYHVCLDVRPGDVDEPDPTRVAVVSMVGPGPDGADAQFAAAPVFARWTSDEELSTRISPKVAAYTDRVELADAVQAGLRARREGDEQQATAKLGRALSLARAAGDEHTAKLLARVVEVEPVTGTVKLRQKVSAEDELSLDTESTKTSRLTP